MHYLNNSAVDSLTDFIVEKRQSYVILVYGDEDLMKSLRNKGVKPVVVEQVEKWSTFRDLGKPIRSFSLLIGFCQS